MSRNKRQSVALCTSSFDSHFRASSMTRFSLLVVVIFLTLAFEFSNGWHDAANSIATVVSTRVLTPFRAVAWAAFWNFIAAFVFGTAVAKRSEERRVGKDGRTLRWWGPS